MKKDTVIEVKDLTKTYTLKHEKPALIDSLFSRTNQEKHFALDDISFTVEKGDTLGIIGHNGSGKTTLLKLLSGITKQTSGKISVKGKLVSLIDLEAGFHPDLTGEENIMLNGLIIGMTKAEIQKQKKSIIRFADIGKFIDAPIHTYSRGMKLRLGFSVAMYARPDILVLDEDFSVGDEKFREKAHRKIVRFTKTGGTLIVVSHWLDEIKKNCNKVLCLDHGKILSFGDAKVVEKYKRSN